MPRSNRIEAIPLSPIVGIPPILRRAQFGEHFWGNKNPAGGGASGEPAKGSQQMDKAAIDNYAKHHGLTKEGREFAHQQAGLPAPTAEEIAEAVNALPARPEQPEKKSPSLNRGGFYLGKKPQ